MKPELPPASDPLLQLLDEWQVQAEPSSGFEQALRQRIAMAEARRGGRVRRMWEGWLEALTPSLPVAAAAAALILVVAASLFLHVGQAPQPAAAPRVQMAAVSDPVVQDLQALDRDGDLIDHLDFLSAPAPASTAPRVQDRD